MVEKEYGVHTIAELVNEYRPAQSSFDSALGGVEVLAVFDHDYSFHVLVQQWDHFADVPVWTYSLWLFHEGSLTHVNDFDAPWPKPPFVEAARIAETWRGGH